MEEGKSGRGRRKRKIKGKKKIKSNFVILADKDVSKMQEPLVQLSR